MFLDMFGLVTHKSKRIDPRTNTTIRTDTYFDSSCEEALKEYQTLKQLEAEWTDFQN